MAQEALVSSETRLEKLCYSVEEAAAVIGLSTTTLKSLVHAEGFPVFRVGRRILVKRDKLKEWVDNHPEGLGDRYVRKE